MTKNKNNQLRASEILIHGVLLFLIDQATAMNEIIKKKTSIIFHQEGVPEQHVALQLLAMNKKGVAAQWIKHNPLDTTPIKSDRDFNDFETMRIQFECKNSQLKIKCNSVALIVN